MVLNHNYNKKGKGEGAYKILEQELSVLTSRFDLDDWRDLRTEHYWKSDEIEDKTQRLLYKIKLIQYYIKYGKAQE
jgi:hypothetical protein